MNRPQLLLTSLLSLPLLLSAPARADKDLAAGHVFKDCPACPEMVVLPAGSFVMGAPDDEVGRQPDEGPLHKVTFDTPFAVSRFHITVEEWAAYARDAGVVLKDGDTRPGRECVAGKPRYPQTPRHPAVCVDFDDAKSYIEWLSRRTGKPYGMLSEAQWEYAARAGSSGPFPFPFDEPGVYTIHRHANTYGEEDGFSHVAPVGRFPPNAFGLYDMHGNVHEWLADCFHRDYLGAPGDGSAWLSENEGQCDYRQIRGNDWIEPPIFSRSGNRNNREPYVRGDWIGFRIVLPLQASAPRGTEP